MGMIATIETKTDTCLSNNIFDIHNNITVAKELFEEATGKTLRVNFDCWSDRTRVHVFKGGEYITLNFKDEEKVTSVGQLLKVFHKNFCKK